MPTVEGLVLGAVGAIDQLAQRLANLKKRSENYGTLPDNWHSSMAIFEDRKNDVESVATKLLDAKESVGEEETNTFSPIFDKIEESLEKADPFLKTVEDEATSKTPAITIATSQAAGSSSQHAGQASSSTAPILPSRTLTDNRPLSWVARLKLALENLGLVLDEIQPDIDRASSAVAAMIVKHRKRCGNYVVHFDDPPLPSNVVLNFNGDTMEADLKRAVLSAGEKVTAAVGQSLPGAVGMGGVGKTVALQGLCYESEVHTKYPDGVFFASLGQDATEKDVIDGIARFVEISGGKTTAKEITSMTSGKAAAKKASFWFEGKTVLFVCDDVWSFDGHPLGLLGSLKLLLCNSPTSAIVISTREQSIAQECNEVKFGPREVRAQQTSSILAKHAGVDTDAVGASSDTGTAFNDMLDVCAGLPLALGIAGSNLRVVIEENSGSIGPSAITVAKELKDNAESVADESVDAYRGLRAVIETSLQHCDKWAQGADGRTKLGCELVVRDKFEALSVLQKQTWIPLSGLKCLWGIDEQATKQLMAKLSDMHLVMMSRRATPAGEVDGLALHDLVLEQAHRLSVENNRIAVWHAKLLDGYLAKAASDELEENVYECREWWDGEKVPEDGYMERNLARNLALSGGYELESLLSDVRWPMRRMTVGGIVALRDDFQKLTRGTGKANAADEVRSALEESWDNITKSIHSIPFEMGGRLKVQGEYSEFVKRFMSSVSTHIPKPHFVPAAEVRWRPDVGQRFRSDFENLIEALCLGEEFTILAFAQGYDIHIYDLQSMSTVHVLKGHEKAVNCVAISADGCRIVSASDDQTVRVWDGQSGECIVGPLRGHEDSVRRVAVSADGGCIVSASRDKTLRIWDGESGECALGPLRGHESSVECVAMSADGSRIASGSDDKTVRVWDGQSGECVLEPLRGHDNSVSCIAMSTDGKRIVSGSDDKSVRVWDGQSGECVLGPLLGHSDRVSGVAMSANGRRIVSGSVDKTIRIWNGRSGECALGSRHGHDYPVQCVAISEGGSCIVSACLDKKVCIWDGRTGDCVLGPLRGHRSSVECVAMSADGSRIVSASLDKTLRIWDGESGECVQGPLRGHEDSVRRVAMNEDGSRIVSASRDKCIRVWDGKSGESVLGPLRGHMSSVSCVVMSANGRRIVSGSDDKTVRVWDGQTGECVAGPLRGHDDWVSCVGMSAYGIRIVSGSWDKSVRVWDGQSGRCVLGPLRGHDDLIRCVAISADGSKVVSAAGDSTLRVWDGVTGQIKFGLLRFLGMIKSLEFEAGSDYCVVTTSGEVFVLNTSAGYRVQRPGYVYDNEGKIYVTRQNAKSVQVATMPSECMSLCYNRQQSKAAVGLGDGQVVIADVIM